MENEFKTKAPKEPFDGIEAVGPSWEQIPFRCHRAQWLSEILDMPRQQIYNALGDGKIPANCVVRVGRRIRFKEKETIEWILGGGTV